MIKLLSIEEKQISRQLWENTFKEDSKSFLDYYYSYKTEDNHIFCKFNENKLTSMLHINPFNIIFNKKNIKSYYIVAVATDEAYRKKGYMRQLLNTSLEFMFNEKIPFTFLMPAKEEYYTPFNFSFIYNHKKIELKEITKLKKETFSLKNINEIISFSNNYLSNKYDVYCVRDEKYLTKLFYELKSENGNIVILKDNEKTVGYYDYWGVEKPELREILVDCKLTNLIEEKPTIMARIVNIFSFCENITSKIPININIKIIDPIIKNNNNIFSWKINNKSSKLTIINNTNDYIELTIECLTQFIFGYKKIEDLINSNNINCSENILSSLKEINIQKNIFINEIV